MGSARSAGLAWDMLRLGSGHQPGYGHWDAAICRGVSSARRLDVVSAAGGTGCSHLAARLGALLARRRGARVLGVDAGHDGTLTRLARAAPVAAVEPEARPDQPSGRSLHARVSANIAAEATAALLVGRGGLRLCRPEGQTTSGVLPSDWRRAVNPVLRFFDVVVTDWGHRLPGIDFEAALAGSRAVALVCRADRAAVEQAVSVAAAVRGRTACAVCAVDVDGVGPRAVRAANAWGAVPVRFLPFMKDPAAEVAPAAPRDCVIGLAAALMTFAAGAGLDSSGRDGGDR
jgi:Mrp family chromosome partitioning ATPase